MKKIILILAVAITLITACTNNTSTNTDGTKATQTTSVDTTKMKTGDVYYQCEMHPEVLSVKADSCSKCGMDLEKMIKK